MFIKTTLLCVLIAITIAEPPVSSGPYPPSGWKPKGAPFTLPREFLPQQAANVEVTKEKVEFAGQLVETTTVIPSNSYLPPGDDDNDGTDFNPTEDLLKVQGLPANIPSTFNQQPQQQPQQQPSQGDLNQQEYIPPRTQNNFQPQNNPQFGQFRQQQQSSRQQQQQFAQRQPFGKIQQQQFNYQRQQQQQQQFGQLNAQQFGNQNTQQQQEQGQDQEQESQVQQFGQPENTQFRQGQPQPGFVPQPGFAGPQPGFAAPQPGFAAPQPGFVNPQAGFVPQFGPRQTPTQTYGPPRAGSGNTEDDDDDDDDDENEAAGQAAQLNAAPNSNNFQPSVGTVMALSNGRYYVLTPDNTLQRVLFMTTQTEDEARTNGFTAQLRYMPVEPIRDPIYTYNEKGQLTRIFKK